VIEGGVTVNRLRLEARYGWGLTDIVNQDNPGVDFSAKNRVFSILVGVEFR
jgi:hypothetical protein